MDSRLRGNDKERSITTQSWVSVILAKYSPSFPRRRESIKTHPESVFLRYFGLFFVLFWSGSLQGNKAYFTKTCKFNTNNSTIFPYRSIYYCFIQGGLHIRTTNPIESVFATVRLRTKRARNCGSRETILAMAYKLLESAQKHWKRIKGFNLLTLVVNNVKFNGEQVRDQSDRSAA